MFIDYAKIELQAGNGGNGAVAFRREKYIDKGGPNGGDGGRGGNIIFETNPNLHTLQDIRYKKIYKAKNGEAGGSNNRTGKSGEDLIIEVPCGTIIKNLENQTIIKDLVKENESHIICNGGIGGKGNVHFKSATQQTPRFSQEGTKGEFLSVELELKVLADVGLVGLPNAGKSTLLSVMTTAKPKIADYPFTTLQPHLGIVKYGSYQSFVMADIPGLIKGAAEGSGLGLEFLRHLERTKILLHILDLSPDDVEMEPIKAFNDIESELKKYSQTLYKKPRWLVFNKIDLVAPSDLDVICEKIIDAIGWQGKVLRVSALSGEGCDIIAKNIMKELDEMASEEISS